MLYLDIILLAIVSGFLGRLGGRAKDGHWYDVITDSKARDFGCSIITLGVLLLTYGFQVNHWLAYVLVFGASWGFLSIYWDFLFGDKGNFWFYGFMLGCAYLPAIFCGAHVMSVVIRCFVLAISYGLLHKYLPDRVLKINRATVEEYLRYFILIITLLYTR
jgi:hypothetical protein